MKRTIGVAALLALPLLFTTTCFADTVTFTGPSLPVIGGTDLYGIFSASLTQPTMSNPDWELDIVTNYPVTIPTPGNSIPFTTYDGSGSFSIGDFIITWNGNSYAVVLSAHDGLHAGDLYQADPFSQNQFQTSQQLVGIRNEPVWIVAMNAIDLGAGSISVSLTGNGTAGGQYLITDDFSAPGNFLSTGDFGINVSSFVCANGIIIGNGSFEGGVGPSGGVPEPGTMFLALPVLLALSLARRYMR